MAGTSVNTNRYEGPESLEHTDELRPRDILDYVVQEFRRVGRALSPLVDVDSVQLRVWNSAPPKPRDGQLYVADGTNWNPGSGKGAYLYLGGWRYLG